MKNSLLSLVLAMFLISSLAAQPGKPVISDGFDEPSGLKTKVIQCSNGNTFLFNFTKRNGIELTIYDKDHRLKSKNTLTGKLWDAADMPRSSIDGIYEINGTLTLFIEQLSSRIPSLYRVVISTEDGHLEKEDKLAEMPKYKAGAGYAMAFGNVQPKGFHVAKDRGSDHYSVVAFDGFAEETAQRIELIAYDGNHKEISRAWYDAPENRFKYINYIGLTVAEGSTYMCTYAFNTAAAGGKASVVILSRLKDGSNTATHHPLGNTQDLKNTQAILDYNTETKTLQLLTLSFLKSDKPFFSNVTTKTYGLLLTGIDPQTMAMLYSKPVVAQKVSAYAAAKFGEREKFTGMPMDMVINKDHTVSILMEDISSNPASTFKSLGNIGVLDIDEQGMEKDGYMIRKQQVRAGASVFSLHDRHINRIDFEVSYGGFGTGINTGFHSFDYVNTTGGRYIMYNDHPDNFTRDEQKSPVAVNAITGTNTVCYKLENGKTEKFYLFGEPGKSFESRFAFISSADYNAATGTYAVMMIEQAGRKKQAHLAWVGLR